MLWILVEHTQSISRGNDWVPHLGAEHRTFRHQRIVRKPLILARIFDHKRRILQDRMSTEGNIPGGR